MVWQAGFLKLKTVFRVSECVWVCVSVCVCECVCECVCVSVCVWVCVCVYVAARVSIQSGKAISRFPPF